jgi:hypothetical protein
MKGKLEIKKVSQNDRNLYKLVQTIASCILESYLTSVNFTPLYVSLYPLPIFPTDTLNMCQIMILSLLSNWESKEQETAVPTLAGKYSPEEMATVPGVRSAYSAGFMISRGLVIISEDIGW